MTNKSLRRVLAALLALSLLFALLPAVFAADDYAGWTSFTADFSQPGHMLRHMAMGCLYGIGEEDVPATNLLTPIRPYTFEQKAPDGLQHPNADAVLTAKTFLESGGQWIEVGCPDIKANWYYEESPFQSEANYALYKRQLREMAEKCVEAGLSGRCVYNIFNETDDGSNTWNVANDVWFAAWKDFVETIRAVDPLARFAGPGFANHKMDFLRAWIPWCIENGCAPFQVTLHCLTDGRYNSMDSDIPTVRRICDEAGLTDYEVCVNEYAHHQNLGNPAGLIKYVAALEDNEASGCLAYWHVGNALDDLAADANEPNGAWWLYKMYADMSGTTVKCTTSTSKMNLYGIAAIDEDKKLASALFGGDHAGDEVLYMSGLDKTSAFAGAKYALVTLRSTTYSGTYGPSMGPDLIYRRVLPIENGRIAVPAEGATATTVFCATAVPVEAETDPAEVEGPWKTTLEAESAQRSGGSVVNSNTNYPASGGSLVSLPNTSASLTFTVNVPKDSYYELRTVYGMDTGSSPSNMNNHNPRMGKLDVTIDGNEEEKTTLTLDNTLQQLTCDNVVFDINPWLEAGSHTIKLQPGAGTTGFPAVDCLYLTEKSAPTAEAEDRVFEAEETTFNALGGLKSSPVRISRAGEGFQGPGYVTGLARKVSDGAGLRFVVCTKDSGFHSLTLRYRSAEDAKVGLYLRNTALSLYNKAKDVSLPATDGWAAYDAMLYLEKGVNLIDLDASSDSLALDNIIVRAAPSAAMYTNTYEAESCATDGSVTTAQSDYASGGTYVRGMAGSADGSNKLTLKVGTTYMGFLDMGPGKYQLDIYYSDNELFGNHGTNVALVDRYFTMSVNGGRPKNVYFRNTYSGDCFRVKTVTVELQRGENTIEFWNDDSRAYRRSQGGTILLRNYAPNVDKFTLSPITTPLGFEEHAHETVLRDAKAPTCVSPGFSGDQVCKLCGLTVAAGEELPATGHTLVHHEGQAPGCTEPGWKAYDTCEKCAYTTYEAVDPVGHDWDEGTVTVAPTPTAFGVRTFTCTRCGETRTKKIPPIGYMLPLDVDFTDAGSADSYEIVGKTNAQQTANGLVLKTTRNAVEPCNGQNSGDQANTPEDLVRYELVAAAPWIATLKFDFDPTANNGYYQFFGFYAAEGEDYQNMAGIRGGDGALQNFLRVDGNVTADSSDLNSTPGLASAGTYWFQIEQDGDTYICRRSADGENFTEMFRYADTGIEADHIVIDAYTGMTEGYTFTLKSLTFEASASGPLVDPSALAAAIAGAEAVERGGYTDASLAALDQALADARAALSATEQAAIDAAAAALEAAIAALEPLPVHEHSYTAVVTAPTCTEGGYTTYTCECGDTYKGDETAALGHDFGGWVRTKAPTCTDNGVETRTCARCGEKLTREIEAEGHNYVPAVTEPTCTDKGYTTYTCSICGFSYTADEVDPLEHYYVDGVCIRCEARDPDYKPPFRFDDVQNREDYYFGPVYWAYEHDPQITKGTSDTLFSPNAGCTRAQVVTFLWRAMGEPEPTKTENPFKDVEKGQYYYDAVLWAVEKGVTTGTSADKFSPNSTCTRGQIVTFLWRALGEPKPQSDRIPFEDVKEGEYYTKAILWAGENGVTRGTSETKFSPNATCTRGQIVTFLWRALPERAD